ncbi:MAG: phosphoenolpyruvate--protein phosphotransferase [Azospirillaceae bacterium]|nr:phosphoenolpyruvate--protein phosphotransferase [Azospirillaceae bacterium]
MNHMAHTPAPDGAPLTPAPTTLRAPISGWLIPLSEVPDPVFSERMLGDGVAIDPIGSTLHAPCDGTILTIHRAKHAVTLQIANGAELLMHIGLDTVALGGEGFTPHVTAGQTVKSGDPLITFDLDALAARVKSLVIPILLMTSDSASIALPIVDRAVATGDPLFTVVPAGTPASQVNAVVAAAGAPEARREVRMLDPHGIHARPAGLLVVCAKRFTAEITLQANGRSANCRSTSALMLLGVQHGDLITVVARGSDAAVAADAIAAQITQSTGTDGAPAAAAAPAVAPAPRPATRPAAAAAIAATSDPATVTAVTAAPGLAVGHAIRLVAERLDIVEAGQGSTVEQARLRDALAQVRATIQATIAAAPDAGAKSLEILTAHLSFLDDPDLIDGADALIQQGKSAAFAWTDSTTQQIEALRHMGNALLAERASDLLDVQRRVTLVLLGKTETGPALVEDSILIADDLLPSQLTGLDPARLAGICLAAGGPTSHVAIIAASLGIPALVAAGPAVLAIADTTALILDADNGTLRIDPPAAEIDRARSVAARRRHASQENRASAQAECRMADGTRIEVVANLGSPDDVAAALANGAEGCGLLRSEFMFLERDTAPTEDEQLAQYQATASALQGRPLIIRTLDAGGDKDLSYVELPASENPALGLRGVRMSLWRPNLLRDQLRAILRVQPVGQCRILLPMIATLADLRTVRAMIAEEQANLGLTSPIPVGIMIEVPSAALLADHFAVEADFFSVGTNDLTQYTLAMDRTNPHLAKQVDAFDPAVLRLIAEAARGARAHGRWIGVCGSLASNPLAAPVLIGLGVTELSGTATSLPAIKALVRTLTMETCMQIASQALAQESAAAVRHLLRTRWPEL